ncbi:hypothetical protein DK419_26700 [Methylobacterium terrae]|uniref:Uncharacterized protein n=1 Tax=Methylobacterium terrae TaxID=2202827 RepID=A0A2U8WT66_9HYPH|nr:hypothetical protein [Methylobacterium terrae]AWN49485.1 hypothetical protein DK419_26700 [Methylobacterium terrae]
MLKLNTAAVEPAWIDLLPGVRVQVAPAHTLDVMIAREAGTAAWRDRGDADDVTTSVAAYTAVTTTLARRLIRSWEGVGNEASEPVEPTRETIAEAMTVWPFFEAFDDRVVRPILSAGPQAA